MIVTLSVFLYYHPLFPASFAGKFDGMEQSIFINLSRGELLEIVTEATQLALSKVNTKPDEQKVIKGLRGLAEFIPCSLSKAQQLKNEGKVPFYQDGRLILFNPDEIRAALSGKDGK